MLQPPQTVLTSELLALIVNAGIAAVPVPTSPPGPELLARIDEASVSVGAVALPADTGSVAPVLSTIPPTNVASGIVADGRVVELERDIAKDVYRATRLGSSATGGIAGNGRIDDLDWSSPTQRPANAGTSLLNRSPAPKSAEFSEISERSIRSDFTLAQSPPPLLFPTGCAGRTTWLSTIRVSVIVTSA